MTNAVRLEWLRAFATLMLFIVVMALAAIVLTAAMERSAITASDSGRQFPDMTNPCEADASATSLPLVDCFTQTATRYPPFGAEGLQV